MNAWAQKVDDRPNRCKVCSEYIEAGEQFYYVTELERDARGNEKPVCFRHVKGARP